MIPGSTEHAWKVIPCIQVFKQIKKNYNENNSDSNNDSDDDSDENEDNDDEDDDDDDDDDEDSEDNEANEDNDTENANKNENNNENSDNNNKNENKKNNDKNNDCNKKEWENIVRLPIKMFDKTRYFSKLIVNTRMGNISVIIIMGGVKTIKVRKINKSKANSTIGYAIRTHNPITNQFECTDFIRSKVRLPNPMYDFRLILHKSNVASYLHVVGGKPFQYVGHLCIDINDILNNEHKSLLPPNVWCLSLCFFLRISQNKKNHTKIKHTFLPCFFHICV